MRGKAHLILLIVVFIACVGSVLALWLAGRVVSGAARAVYGSLDEGVDVRVGTNMRIVGIRKMHSYALVRDDNSLVCPEHSSCGDCGLIRMGKIGPDAFVVEGTWFDAKCVERKAFWIVDERGTRGERYDDLHAAMDAVRARYGAAATDRVSLIEERSFEQLRASGR